MSHFFAYVFRAKFIRRWGLMYNTYPESVQEHSLRVAQIAHALAIIKNRLFGGDVNPDRTAVLALYHDASEVLTGDLPTPVKYDNPEIATAYRALERVAREKLLSMVPEPLADAYAPCFRQQDIDSPALELVRAADKICAYVKCIEETSAGNTEFVQAEKTLRHTLDAIVLPEVRYFMDTFVASFRLTLDDLK
jgi:5'-deoxynucleotidase